MVQKKALFILIDFLLTGQCSIAHFCNEYTRLFDLEINYGTLTEQEYDFLYELGAMSARFSDNPVELLIKNMYYNESDIRKFAQEVVQALNLQ